MDNTFRVGISTYPWGFEGKISRLNHFLLKANLEDSLIHILPSYEGERDGGFSPINHSNINPKYGQWSDINTISLTNPVLLDIIICHIDKASVEWQDFLKHGSKSIYADMFLTTDKIYPGGVVPEQERRRFYFFGNPVIGLVEEIVGDGETIVRVQTFLRFQRDFNSNSPLVLKYIEDLLILWASKGVKYCRFDAINTAVKEQGNYPDFYMTPGTYKYIEVLCKLAARHGITPLLELLIAEGDFEKLPDNCMLYDFEYQKHLPYILFSQDFSYLHQWIQYIHKNKGNQTILNVLSNHDGFCWGSKFSLLTTEARQNLIRNAEARLTTDDLKASGFEANNIASNTNTSIYNLCEKNLQQWLFVNILFLFLPEGIPLFYYHDLLCGENDYKAFKETGEGRYIMRTKFSQDYIKNILEGQSDKSEAVQKLLELIRFKNNNTIFDAPYTIGFEQEHEYGISFRWEHGEDYFEIQLDAKNYQCGIFYQIDNQKSAERIA